MTSNNQVFTFEPASRKKKKARIAISGVSGSGKTYSALQIAKGFAPDGQVAVIDSQYGQSCLYSDKFDFRVLEIDTHSPLVYAAAVRAADKQGFDVIIVDSISQAWNGSDGALAQVDKAAKKYSGNTYSAWGDVTPMQLEMIDALIGCKAHVIVTLRSKHEYVLETQSNGKTKPVPIGMGVIQRDGFLYEMDIEIMMNIAHVGEIVKTRYDDLDGYSVEKPDPSLGEYILERLNTGEEAGDSHWSQSFKKRTYLLSQLDKLGIPANCLFECYGATNWEGMKQVSLPEGGSKAIISRVNEYFANEV